MGWNGSSGQVRADAPASRGVWPPSPSRQGLSPRRGGLSPSAVRFVAALVLVAALGLAAWLAVRPDRRPVPGPDGSRTGTVPIPAAGPVPAGKAHSVGTDPAPADGRQAETNEKQELPKTYRDERGVLRYEGGLRVPEQRPLAKPIELGTHRPKVFRHAAEEHISWLLDMRIGEPVIGDYAYGEAFARSFRESLKEPVRILDTDDARTRELKAAVQETKDDLKRRMEAGEDVAKVMNETLNEFRRLARYRHELQTQLHEICADAEKYTDADVWDFTKAANELLEREGLPPLTMPRTVMRGLRRR